MSDQLAYAILTPHALTRSRTGGIISRLAARSGLDLVGARMFSPGLDLVREYAEAIVSKADPQEPRIQELIRDYVLENFSEDSSGRRKRVMVLLFHGEDAVSKVRSVVGNFVPGKRGGQSIRDTYGDLVMDENENVRYFEPTVLAAPTVEEAEAKLRIWTQHSDTDGGVLENVVAYEAGEQPERTLVLLKPDNFRFVSGRPGNMIDFFSRTGLFIVGIKLHRMSVAQALEFYGPVRDVLRTKLRGVVAAKAKTALEKELGFPIPGEEETKLGELLGPLFGENQFENIVEFMAGRRPSACPLDERDQPGTEKCIALVYEGINAVAKIRDVLGPTDPTKAPPGSIRREFGSNVMVNAAHASDSADNAGREMGIVNVGENQFRRVVETFFGKA
ncbi:MAG: nucleoside-diphosphate kinase [Verrucomicrobiales bacterium]|nr:nucleoside-diphosphate kinase [Verrucomicrobiales bacterium]MCP5527195.1 nucleoside-diphosphate kinase [Verrucomicrobiales bacterium]